MIAEQLDRWTCDLRLVGAKRTVRVRRLDIAALGKPQAIQEAVTRAWRTARMLRQVREARLREQTGPYPV